MLNETAIPLAQAIQGVRLFLTSRYVGSVGGRRSWKRLAQKFWFNCFGFLKRYEFASPQGSLYTSAETAFSAGSAFRRFGSAFPSGLCAVEARVCILSGFNLFRKRVCITSSLLASKVHILSGFAVPCRESAFLERFRNHEQRSWAFCFEHFRWTQFSA